MNWIFVALLSYVLLAVVFIIDKSLLKGRTVLASPWKYALASSLLALLTVALLPWTDGFPASVFSWLLLAAVAHIAALGYFFTALQRGEVSTVVPLTGSISPVATLVLALFLLEESLLWQQGAGLVLVIVGAVLLSFRLTGNVRITTGVLKHVLLAGILFATYFVIMKEAYAETTSFLSVFVYSRLVEGVLAAVLWVWWFGRPAGVSTRHDGSTSLKTWGWFGLGKALAAVAFFLQHMAVSQGSVVVVNGLQGTQYLFLLGGAVLLSRHWPALLREEFGRVVRWQKIAGVLLIAGGVSLLI